jgi:hypothetical protein
MPTVRFASTIRKPGTVQLDVIENGPATPSPSFHGERPHVVTRLCIEGWCFWSVFDRSPPDQARSVVILHKTVGAATKAYFCQTAVFPHGEHSYVVLLVGMLTVYNICTHNESSSVFYFHSRWMLPWTAKLPICACPSSDTER